jgi:hypothetical protein
MKQVTTESFADLGASKQDFVAGLDAHASERTCDPIKR